VTELSLDIKDYSPPLLTPSQSHSYYHSHHTAVQGADIPYHTTPLSRASRLTRTTVGDWHQTGGAGRTSSTGLARGLTPPFTKSLSFSLNTHCKTECKTVE